MLQEKECSPQHLQTRVLCVKVLSFVQSNGDFAVLWQCFFCCSLQKGAESGPSARLLEKIAVAEGEN